MKICIVLFAPALSLSSCAIITTPVKIVGKTTITAIGLTGKAAGAGINALRTKDEPDSAE